MANGTKLIDEVKLVSDLKKQVDFLEERGIYTTMAKLKAAGIGDYPRTLITAAGGRVEYAYLTGDYTGQEDGITIVKLDNVALNIGALVLQDSASLAYKVGLDIPAILLQDAMRQAAVMVHMFRKPGDVDDTEACRRAIAQGGPVRFVAGKGSLPNGDYQLSQLTGDGSTSLINRSNITIIGDGYRRTVIRPNPNSGYCFHGLGSKRDGSIDGNIFNTRFQDIAFSGYVVEKGFQEHTHLIALSGVTNVDFLRCAFVGFRGDAVYIGQGNVIVGNYKNERVNFKDCYFDGVNNNNRNAISFIDISSSMIDNCYFVRCSRNGSSGWKPGDAFDPMNPLSGPGMPGAIDYEPDNFANVKINNNIIKGCTFNGIGGNVSVVGIHVPDVPGIPYGFSVINNIFMDTIGRGGEIYVHKVRPLASPLTSADIDMQVVITNNIGRNGNQIYGLFNVKGVTISGNRWTNYRAGNIFGYVNDDRNMKILSAKICNDTYTRCANLAASRILNQVFNAEDVTFDSNTYDDCGDGTPFAYLFSFNAGTSTGITLTNNKVLSPTNRTGHSVIVESTHITNPATNRQCNNDWGTRTYVSNQFKARVNDLPTNYTPIVEGHTSAGSATYTRQYGEYTFANGWVNGYAEVFWTGHTGTGQIKFSVPIDPADLNGDSFPVQIILETTGAGNPGVNKIISAQVHGFANTSAGPGSVRGFVLDQSTGQRVALALLNTDYKAYIRFSYRAQ